MKVQVGLDNSRRPHFGLRVVTDKLSVSDEKAADIAVEADQICAAGSAASLQQASPDLLQASDQILAK